MDLARGPRKDGTGQEVLQVGLISTIWHGISIRNNKASWKKKISNFQNRPQIVCATLWKDFQQECLCLDGPRRLQRHSLVLRKTHFFFFSASRACSAQALETELPLKRSKTTNNMPILSLCHLASGSTSIHAKKSSLTKAGEATLASPALRVPVAESVETILL